MDVLLGRFVFGVLLPLVAVFLAILAFSAVRRRSAPAGSEERIVALEEQVRGLLYRVFTLEQSASAPPREQLPAAAPDLAPTASPPPPPLPPEPPAPVEPVEVGAPATAGSKEPRQRAIDLEQRIGARWATWVGVVAILFGIGFFLKWSFENDLLGPGARVALGLVAGAGLVMNGLLLHRRRDVPYLSEGLAGLGLGVLYLSLYGAHAVYELVGPGLAFAGMLAVTPLGALGSSEGGVHRTPALAAMEIVRVSGLQMFLWVFALHDSVHHPSGSNFVAQPDAQVHKIPTGNKDQKKGQHFSRAHNELDHRSFPCSSLMNGTLPLPR